MVLETRIHTGIKLPLASAVPAAVPVVPIESGWAECARAACISSPVVPGRGDVVAAVCCLRFRLGFAPVRVGCESDNTHTPAGSFGQCERPPSCYWRRAAWQWRTTRAPQDVPLSSRLRPRPARCGGRAVRLVCCLRRVDALRSPRAPEATVAPAKAPASLSHRLPLVQPSRCMLLLRLANAPTPCYNVGLAPMWQWRPVYMAKRKTYVAKQNKPLSPRVVALRAGQAGRSPWEGTRSASLSDRAGAMCSAGASSCRSQTTRPRRRCSRGRGARQTRQLRTWGQRLGRRSMVRTRCVHRDGDCCTSMMTSSLSKRWEHHPGDSVVYAR
jgi:hypothetical protein